MRKTCQNSSTLVTRTTVSILPGGDQKLASRLPTDGQIIILFLLSTYFLAIIILYQHGFVRPLSVETKVLLMCLSI